MSARARSQFRFAPLAGIALAVLVLASPAGGALDAGQGLRFGTLPKNARQGKSVSIVVVVPTGARCTLVVRYGDGQTQPGSGSCARRPDGRGGASASPTRPRPGRRS